MSAEQEGFSQPTAGGVAEAVVLRAKIAEAWEIVARIRSERPEHGAELERAGDVPGFLRCRHAKGGRDEKGREAMIAEPGTSLDQAETLLTIASGYLGGDPHRPEQLPQFKRNPVVSQVVAYLALAQSYVARAWRWDEHITTAGIAARRAALVRACEEARAEAARQALLRACEETGDAPF